MRVISSQLDESADEEDYRAKILALNLDEKTTEKLCREADRLRGIPGSSQEAFVIKNYLDTILELPWNKESKGKVSIKKAETILNKDHFGLKRSRKELLKVLLLTR